MLGDVRWYYRIAQSDYPELLELIDDMPEDTAHQYIAEVAYFYMHREIPEWACQLGAVEILRNLDTGEERFIFVQRDPSQAN